MIGIVSGRRLRAGGRLFLSVWLGAQSFFGRPGAICYQAQHGDLC